MNAKIDRKPVQYKKSWVHALQTRLQLTTYRKWHLRYQTVTCLVTSRDTLALGQGGDPIIILLISAAIEESIIFCR